MAYTTVDLRGELPGQPWSNINALELDRKGFVPEKKPGRFVLHSSAHRPSKVSTTSTIGCATAKHRSYKY
jgi:hypothetical protein